MASLCNDGTTSFEAEVTETSVLNLGHQLISCNLDVHPGQDKVITVSCWQWAKWCICPVASLEFDRHCWIKQMKGLAKCIEITACRWALEDSGVYEKYLPRLEIINGLIDLVDDGDEILHKAIALLLRWSKIDALPDHCHTSTKAVDTKQQVKKIRNVLYGAFDKSIHCLPVFGIVPVETLINLAYAIKGSECKVLWPMVAAYQRMSEDKSVPSLTSHRVHKFVQSSDIDCENLLPIPNELNDFDMFKSSLPIVLEGGASVAIGGELVAETLSADEYLPIYRHCDHPLRCKDFCLHKSLAYHSEDLYRSGLHYLMGMAATVEFTACQFALCEANIPDLELDDFPNVNRLLYLSKRQDLSHGVQRAVTVLQQWCTPGTCSPEESLIRTAQRTGDIHSQVSAVMGVLYGGFETEIYGRVKPIIGCVPIQTAAWVAQVIKGDKCENLWPLLAAYERMNADTSIPKLTTYSVTFRTYSEEVLETFDRCLNLLPLASTKDEGFKKYMQYRGTKG